MDELFFSIWNVVDETGSGDTPPEQNALIQNDGDFVLQTDSSLILILE